MDRNLKFETVRTQKQFDDLKKFATSFDHVVDDTTLLPLITVSRGDKMFAYYTVLNYPVVFPSFHTELCTPRDFVDSVNTVKHHHMLSSMNERFPNGTFFVALSANKLAIDRSYIPKLGLKNLEMEIHQAGGAE